MTRYLICGVISVITGWLTLIHIFPLLWSMNIPARATTTKVHFNALTLAQAPLNSGISTVWMPSIPTGVVAADSKTTTITVADYILPPELNTPPAESISHDPLLAFFMRAVRLAACALVAYMLWHTYQHRIRSAKSDKALLEKFEKQDALFERFGKQVTDLGEARKLLVEQAENQAAAVSREEFDQLKSDVKGITRACQELADHVQDMNAVPAEETKESAK